MVLPTTFCHITPLPDILTLSVVREGVTIEIVVDKE